MSTAIDARAGAAASFALSRVRAFIEHIGGATQLAVRAGRALLMKEVGRLEQTKSKVISGEIVKIKGECLLGHRGASGGLVKPSVATRMLPSG